MQIHAAIIIVGTTQVGSVGEYKWRSDGIDPTGLVIVMLWVPVHPNASITVTT